MSTTICRPFITLKNGRVLFASEVGKKAFCFAVDEIKEKEAKTPSLFGTQDEVDAVEI